MEDYSFKASFVLHAIHSTLSFTRLETPELDKIGSVGKIPRGRKPPAMIFIR